MYNQNTSISKGYLANKNNFFCFAYFIIVISEIFLRYTNIDDAISQNIIDYGISVLRVVFIVSVFIIYVFYQKYNIRSLLLLIALISLFSILYLVNRATGLLFSILIILASRQIDRDKFYKFVLYVLSSVILITMLLVYFGVINQTVKQRLLDDTTRYALGFTHPNTLSILVFQCMCCYIYINRNEIKNIHLFLISIVTLIIYLVTNSNTFIVISICLILGTIIVRRLTNIKNYSYVYKKRMVKFIVIIAVLIFGIAIYYYWKNPYELKGSLRTFRARFTLSQKYINAYGINLLGANIKTGSSVSIPGYVQGYYFLDNGYTRVLVEYGIIASIFILIAMVKYIHNLIKYGRWQMLVITFCMFIYFFCEQKLMMVFFNPFVVDIGITFFQKYESVPQTQPDVLPVPVVQTPPDENIDEGSDYETAM